MDAMCAFLSKESSPSLTTTCAGSGAASKEKGGGVGVWSSGGRASESDGLAGGLATSSSGGRDEGERDDGGESLARPAQRPREPRRPRAPRRRARAGAPGGRDSLVPPGRPAPARASAPTSSSAKGSLLSEGLAPRRRARSSARGSLLGEGLAPRRRARSSGSLLGEGLAPGLPGGLEAREAREGARALRARSSRRESAPGSLLGEGLAIGLPGGLEAREGRAPARGSRLANAPRSPGKTRRETVGAISAGARESPARNAVPRAPR